MPGRGKGRGKGRHRGFGKRSHQKFRSYDYSCQNIKELQEDILRMIVEKGIQPFPIAELINYCGNTKKLGRVLDLMEQHFFITFEDSHISLTQKGETYGMIIAKKHQAIENAFQNPIRPVNSHKIASILEHSLTSREIEQLVFMQQAKNIKSIPLNLYNLPQATIYRITFDSEKLFYKMLSLGIYPGQRIEISHQNNNNQIIKVKNSRFAIDRIIARNIQVIP